MCVVRGRERWRQSDFEFVSIRWMRPNIYHSMCDSACVECIHILIEWNIQQSTAFVYSRVWVNHFTVGNRKKVRDVIFEKFRMTPTRFTSVISLLYSCIWRSMGWFIYLPAPTVVMAVGRRSSKGTILLFPNAVLFQSMWCCSTPPISVYIIPIEWKHSFPHDGVHHLFDLLRTDFCTQLNSK